MSEFCNGYNFANLAEEKICYKITQNQICIDPLQISDGQSFPNPIRLTQFSQLLSFIITLFILGL